MFKPNLDLGNKWVAVDSYTVALNRFSHQHLINLNIRADALIIHLSSENTKDTWRVGGAVYQSWEFEGEIYQTSEAQVRLQNRHVISIEPLVKSQLLFVPVDWLYNWKLEVWAREYQPSGDDLLFQILANQTLIIDKLDDLQVSAEAKAVEIKRRIIIAS